MWAIAESAASAKQPATRKEVFDTSSNIQEYQEGAAQLHLDSALMDESSHSIFLQRIYGYPQNERWRNFVKRRFETILHMVQIENYTRSRASDVEGGRITFEQFVLAYRPVLKGTLEQTAAHSFHFYDRDFKGFMTSTEVAKMVLDLPVGAYSEQDLLSLLAHFGGKKDFFTFGDYYDHIQVQGMHRGVQLQREQLLRDEFPKPISTPRS